MRQKLRSHLTYANVMVTILAFIVLGGTTYAATGGNFILGQANTAGSTTALSSGTTGPAFKVTSTNTAAGATALRLNAASGHAPFTVNSGTKVANLNADKLDGSDSSQLKGARAYAFSGGEYCPDPPVSFCSVERSKGVAYVVKVGQEDYCVGVNGISAADPKTIALVSILQTGDPDWTAEWTIYNLNCVATEFEVFTAHRDGGFGLPRPAFTIVIP
jgi:hypothetical protein